MAFLRVADLLCGSGLILWVGESGCVSIVMCLVEIGDKCAGLMHTWKNKLTQFYYRQYIFKIFGVKVTQIISFITLYPL